MIPATDTIAAVATAPGEGALCVLRVSGPAAFAVADAVFRAGGPPPSSRPSHTVVHGQVVGAAGETMDDVLLVLMRGPHSYTGEDVVEFQCHGGRVTAARVLRRLVEMGCRPAEPGEFTRRAFLHGRIDLSQAEAVCDLIRAKSEGAARVALEQLSGHFGRKISAVYDRLVSIRAGVEVSLDFPDEGIPDADPTTLVEELKRISADLTRMASNARGGRLLRNGVRAVIMGLPNVGKSSLFNALLGFDRSIVFSVPGTTRDTIEESIEIAGYPVRLVDTAGLRDSDCAIEAEGVRRAESEIASADIRILVVDSSQFPDKKELAEVNASRGSALVLVRNKSDLEPCPAWDPICVNMSNASVCLLQYIGVELVVDCISRVLPGLTGMSGVPDFVVSERHAALLLDASENILTAIAGLLSPSTDGALVAITLRTATECLGRIMGRDIADDLLDSIFSKFCIGK